MVEFSSGFGSLWFWVLMAGIAFVADLIINSLLCSGAPVRYVTPLEKHVGIDPYLPPPKTPEEAEQRERARWGNLSLTEGEKHDIAVAYMEQLVAARQEGRQPIYWGNFLGQYARASGMVA
jgi:hypothetical protein